MLGGATMSFDDEVERLKRELADERGDDREMAERLEALDRMRGQLEARIASRRVEFHLEDGQGADDEPSIRVLYAANSDELGAIFFENGEYAFESEDEDYFADVPETKDPERFAGLLYECLKVGLPAYELDMGEE
ncbi:MAG: hypothetical protein PVI23_00335 [Maricaulaceae bacterium]|jgi:hypothetical protein